ncbi:MAG: carbamoyltransferase C-terminal domain-containing protein [Candidatus Fonsibacter ubiquis]
MLEYKNVTYNDVVQILLEQKIVALFQGKSEGGPRALGNRSILFDPRNTNGKDIVNTIKRREPYRPFAGTILLDHAKDWFDMAGLKESPFMLYAMNIREDKKTLVPGIVHVDGTCRIQTLTKDQNYHYYNLIKCFYDKTGVPILLNTSFNLAGKVLVHNFRNAVDVLNDSMLEYLYLPEEKKLFFVRNNNPNVYFRY